MWRERKVSLERNRSACKDEWKVNCVPSAQRHLPALMTATSYAAGSDGALRRMEGFDATPVRDRWYAGAMFGRWQDDGPAAWHPIDVTRTHLITA